jgi:hypothetical protein
VNAFEHSEEFGFVTTHLDMNVQEIILPALVATVPSAVNDPFLVLLDNQASHGFFHNSELLHHMRDRLTAERCHSAVQLMGPEPSVLRAATSLTLDIKHIHQVPPSTAFLGPVFETEELKLEVLLIKMHSI